LIDDERPNEAKAHENDESIEDTYDDNNDFFFSILTKSAQLVGP
jgi:hypothetical protein